MRPAYFLRCRVVALFHAATIAPTKDELHRRVGPDQAVGASRPPIPSRSSAPTGSTTRTAGSAWRPTWPGRRVLLQVPLTYRDEPLAGADEALITEMEHSVLGTRWVYDGLRDPRFVVMLAP